MGLLSLLPERRAIDASAFGLNTDGGWQVLSASGVSVDADGALQVPTFASCVLRKQDAFMAMPVDAYVTEGDRRVPVAGPRWLTQPNPDDLWEQFAGMVSNSFELGGAAFVAVGRDRAGRAQELRVMDRTATRVTRAASGRKVIEFDGREFPGEAIHIRRSPDDRSSLASHSVVDLNRDLFAKAIAVNRYASSVFGSGGVPPFVFAMDGPPDNKAADDVAKWWRQARQRHGFHTPGFIYGGKPMPIGWDVEKSQLVNVQNAIGVEIASLCRVPTHFVGLGVQGDSVKYENVVAAWIGFVREALLTPMRLIERALSDDSAMLMPKAQRMRFRTEVFEKADTKGRYEAYQIGINAGFLTVDDVRAWEDLAAIPADEQVSPVPAV